MVNNNQRLGILVVINAVKKTEAIAVQIIPEVVIICQKRL